MHSQETQPMKGYILSTFAGCCGALASFTGKLIGSEHSTYLSEIMTDDLDFQWYFSLMTRAVFLSLTVLINGIMWTLFVEAMQHLSASKSLVVE